ncbi:lipase [Cronobacter turicensis]|nr:lipase [Cronobacter turicensis]ELQ6270424.1 lipase [Cronobacter turicensis]
MMITISGRHALRRAAVLLWSLVFTQAGHAWQQEYIAVDPQSNTSERYTWDSDRTPSYDEILAERVAQTQRDEAAMSVMPAGLSLSWPLPVVARPVAGWRREASGLPLQENGVSTDDAYWHASVGSLGWRLDSRLGAVRPWAQVSYNQQHSDPLWNMQPLLPGSQYGSWMDVSFGADMPINKHLAAWASFSQAEGRLSENDAQMYNLGVSATF